MPSRLSPTINFLSINVGRGGSTHDIALSRAFELDVDVILIQEPWWSNITKSHPAFDCHVPFGGMNVRPRAITYTRRNNLKISAKQIFPSSNPTGDYCWVVVNGVTFLNVYKAPNNTTSIQTLISWTPPPRTVAIGDFNSVHWAWQPGVSRSYGQGEEIEIWAETHNLSCLIIGEPTHRAGNTLDLAWSNIPGTQAWVDRKECMTSDHLPLRGLVSTPFQVISTPPSPIRVTRSNISKFARTVAQWASPPPPLINTEDIEIYAQDLCTCLSNAIKATGSRTYKRNNNSAPWWTTDCKEAHIKYRTASNSLEHSNMARKFRATVSAAKREYWKGRVEAMTSSSEAFKLMRWNNPRQRRNPPPLIYNNRTITDQETRANTLRDALLLRHQATDDLPPCPIPPVARIPWTNELSSEEVRVCTIGCSNKSPGADGISVDLLSACWKTIGPYVVQLFRACIRLGFHPSCFKLAEVIFLQKHGRDPSTVKAWRPISLLSCLGKGLERVIAKRMSYLAIVHSVVGRQQFGALSKRAATDLVSCVVHDIEEARSQGWASTFVTLDVQGAFDAVLHNRLIWRMNSQGWPDFILNWTSSFLNNRRVQVRFQGGTTNQTKLTCGVPQGSPISPLLFLLYMAEPMNSGNTRMRFSYADDIGILGIGRSVSDSADLAQREVDDILGWAHRNAVSFDIEKSEVIQFTGRKRENPVGLRVGNTLIEPAEHIRWLGVHLDPRLNFKHHVTTWCGKALKAAEHIRRLNSVKRGAAPGPLVRAVDSCILSVAMYGSEVWWPGLTRPTTRGIITPQTSHLCELIDRVIRKALRAALPVWKTTPNAVIHREGGIPPARIVLESNRIRLAARIKSLDNRHPLRSRASICPNIGTLKYKAHARMSVRPEIQMTRVQRTYRQLPQAEIAHPISAPVYPESLGTKASEVNRFKLWARQISRFDICAFSDGSSEGHGRSAWGFSLQKDGVTICSEHGPLHGGEIIDAEIFGAYKALEKALEYNRADQQIHVLLDNQAAVLALQTGRSSSSLTTVINFRELAHMAHVSVKWIPGHSEIRGNDEADAEARAGLRQLPQRNVSPESISHAFLRRLVNQRRQSLLDAWWDKACPARYRALNLQMRRRKPPELCLPRRLLHELIAARTGHGNYAAYHRRFQHKDATLECICGKETSPTHFIRCQNHAHHARRFKKSMPYCLLVYKLIGPKCLNCFTKFAKVTGCFGSRPIASSSALSEDHEN